jgi:hypothetical protein
VLTASTFDEPPVEIPLDGPSREEVVVEIWAAVLHTYQGWVDSGRFTLTELRTIRVLLLEGRSLREFARREQVTPAAISCRIDGLEFKAPQFFRWWAATHRRRRQPHAR